MPARFAALRMPFDSRNEGSKCEARRGGLHLARPLVQDLPDGSAVLETLPEFVGFLNKARPHHHSNSCVLSTLVWHPVSLSDQASASEFQTTTLPLPVRPCLCLCLCMSGLPLPPFTTHPPAVAAAAAGAFP